MVCHVSGRAALGALAALSLLAPARTTCAQTPPPLDNRAQERAKVVGEAAALARQAMARLNAGAEDDARALLLRAVELYRQTDDGSGLGGTLVNLGILESRNDPRTALKRFDEARTVLHAAGNAQFEGNALNNQGTVYQRLGQVEEAERCYDQAIALYRTARFPTGEGSALYHQGTLYFDTGRPEQAQRSFEKARQIARTVGDRGLEGRALLGLAEVCKLSAPRRAAELYQQLLATIDAARDPDLALALRKNLGDVYVQTGQIQKALENLQQAVALARASHNVPAEALGLESLGATYLQTDQLARAGESFERMLALARAQQDTIAEARALNGLSRIYLLTRQPQKALEPLDVALRLARKSGSRSDAAYALQYLGSAARQMGRYAAARERLEESLTLFHALQDKIGEAATRGELGSTFQALGQLDAAEASTTQAAPLYRAVGDRYGEALCYESLGDIDRARNRLSRAAARYDQAIALAERFRADLGGFAESKSRFLASQLPLYYRALETRLRLGDTARAFDLAQKTKARSLLDLLAAGKVDLNRGLAADERGQLEALRQQADRLNQQMVREGIENEVGAKKRYAELQRQLAALDDRLQTLTETLYARHPGLADKRVARTARLADLARTLPADTALLEYVVVSEKQVALFVLAGRRVTAHILPVAYPELARRASSLRAACADPRQDYRNAAADLHRLLIAPAAARLAGAKRLVICPDGALWDVPFQALLSHGRFLARRYEIAYAYSATGAQAALTAKRKKPTGALLALANPDFGSAKRFGDLDGVPGQRPIDAPSRPIDAPSRPIDAPSRPIDAPSRAFDAVSRGGRIAPLPGTQREADALRKAFPAAAVLTGSAAQESAAKQKASQYKYLHFATHGIFNDASPMLSSLVLAQPKPGGADDGFLTAREIFEMDLSAEMAVLSACNTARGVQRTGDGVLGLTWALFAAGCPTQIVSQWAVDDASTATLMGRFYKELPRGKGAALRQAQLSLMANPKRSHPYYWAPFVLIGDWR